MCDAATAGIYADLDVEALRSLEEVLVGHRVFLAQMGPQEDFREAIPNAWFAAVPGHPLWLFCLRGIIARQAVAEVQPDECVAHA
jgi:mannosyltransferase OCH1-like enzyme